MWPWILLTVAALVGGWLTLRTRARRRRVIPRPVGPPPDGTEERVERILESLSTTSEAFLAETVRDIDDLNKSGAMNHPDVLLEMLARVPVNHAMVVRSLCNNLERVGAIDEVERLGALIDARPWPDKTRARLVQVRRAMGARMYGGAVSFASMEDYGKLSTSE